MTGACAALASLCSREMRISAGMDLEDGFGAPLGARGCELAGRHARE
jgi:hypothetical protein